MIKAEIVAITYNSYTNKNKPIVTVKLTLPKVLLAQLNTHRQLSRSAESSRAVSAKTMIAKVENTDIFWEMLPDTFGMYGQPKTNTFDKDKSLSVFLNIKSEIIKNAKVLEKLKLHKEVLNRILEPFALVNVLVTATEVKNLFKLRAIKPGAQGPINACITDFMNKYNEALTNVDTIKYKSFHVPYVISDKLYENDVNYKYYNQNIFQFLTKMFDYTLNYNNTNLPIAPIKSYLVQSLTAPLSMWANYFYTARKAARESFGTSELDEPFAVMVNKVLNLRKEEHNSVFEHSAVTIEYLGRMLDLELALHLKLKQILELSGLILPYEREGIIEDIYSLIIKREEYKVIRRLPTINSYNEIKEYSMFYNNGAFPNYTANFVNWMPMRNIMDNFPLITHMMNHFIKEDVNTDFSTDAAIKSYLLHYRSKWESDTNYKSKKDDLYSIITKFNNE